MFSKILIANRGEIAIRIDQTLQAMGITGIGVYTRGDQRSLHVRRLRESVRLEDRERTGYLDINQLIAAALTTGCQAVHPGYGFLAENAEFARRCSEAGLVFIGPTPEVIANMGEKIAAREYAERAGLPVAPGVSRPNLSDEEILDACRSLAFPLLVKPSAGGGGKGLHVVHTIDELVRVLPTARREAAGAFGDDTLFIEKYVANARHIEFQVLADHHGAALHLGERECSLQRRHQKVIEEAPSPLLTPNLREVMGDAAVSLVCSIGYRNAGTIEFLVDADNPDQFYFMEMNTRLQVEHRVTEMVTGIDLVEAQVRIANGEHLDDVVPNLQFCGHAIEARVYAEDPYHGFLPTGGRVGRYEVMSGPTVVVDSAIETGQVISSSFDPMLAKVSAWGADRSASSSNLLNELRHFELLGVTTNIDFLVELISRGEFRDGNFTTRLIELLPWERPLPPGEVLQAYASIASSGKYRDSWRTDGWRVRGAPPVPVIAYVDGARYEVMVDQDPEPFDWWRDGESIWLHHPEFGTWQVFSKTQSIRARSGSDSAIVSPMPGVVIAMQVSVGDHVLPGQPLITIEAMKMEHILRAKDAGVVSLCHVEFGSSVRAGQLLLEVSPHA